MSLSEWWIDGAIATDSAGNLYATWDTQSGSSDVGWLSFSTDHGRHWSNLVRVTPDVDNAAHIVEVAGGRAGDRVRRLAHQRIAEGVLRVPARVLHHRRLADVADPRFGQPLRCAAGLAGIPSASRRCLAPECVLTWGSGVAISGQPKSEIFAATVHF